MTIMLGNNVSTPILKSFRGNVMEEFNNVMLDEILQITNAIQNLDCNWVYAILYCPRIQNLYPFDLNNTLYSYAQKQPLYRLNSLRNYCL